MRSRPDFPSLSAAGPFARGALCAALGLSLATAQTQLPEDAPPGDEEPKGFLAGSLLPNGSRLKKVVIPSYGPQLHLTGTVSADELEIVTRKKIDATNLLIEFFNPDRTPRGRIAMAKARFTSSKDLNLLTTEEPVSFVSDDLTVNGAGLVFDVDHNRGFLRGPVKAVAKSDLRTSMNAKPARRALAAGALLMATATALPAQEKELTSAEKFAALRLTPDDLARVTTAAASRRPMVSETAEVADKSFSQARTQSEDARITMNSFFQAAALASLLAEPAPAAGDVPRPAGEPLPQEMTITSRDGAYLDSVEGLAIFLKEVELQSPRFKMKGADEVKIFMAPQKPDGGAKNQAEPPAENSAREAPVIDAETAAKMKAAKEAAKAAGKKAADSSGGDFGDVLRIVATGVVVVEYQSADPQSPSAKASARTMVYDFDKEQIILRGGSPWFIQDDRQVYVTGNDAYILVNLKDGNVLNIVTGNQELLTGKVNLPENSDPKKAPEKKPETR